MSWRYDKAAGSKHGELLLSSDQGLKFSGNMEVEPIDSCDPGPISY